MTYHADTMVFMERHGVPLPLRLPPFLAEGVVGLLADATFTVSQTYRRKVAESRALHGRAFHATCWGAMVNRSIFSPAVVSEEERRALRSTLTFGSPDDSFLLVYAGRISAEKGLDFCTELVRNTKVKKICFAIIGAGPQEAVFARMHGTRAPTTGNRIYCVPKFVAQTEVRCQPYALLVFKMVCAAN